MMIFLFVVFILANMYFASVQMKIGKAFLETTMREHAAKDAELRDLIATLRDHLGVKGHVFRVNDVQEFIVSSDGSTAVFDNGYTAKIESRCVEVCDAELAKRLVLSGAPFLV